MLECSSLAAVEPLVFGGNILLFVLSSVFLPGCPPIFSSNWHSQSCVSGDRPPGASGFQAQMVAPCHGVGGMVLVTKSVGSRMKVRLRLEGWPSLPAGSSGDLKSLF